MRLTLAAKRKPTPRRTTSFSSLPSPSAGKRKRLAKPSMSKAPAKGSKGKKAKAVVEESEEDDDDNSSE